MMKEQKKRVKARFWKDFEPVIEMNGGERLCWLKCIKEGCVCGQLLSILNPGRSGNDHFKQSRQAGGLDEEIRLSLIDLVEGGEEEEEEEEEM